jgi:hypothetical protein
MVGKYSDGAEGYKHIVSYDIVDYQTKKTIYKARIEGSDPPASKSFAGPAYGSNPLFDLKDQIASQLQAK